LPKRILVSVDPFEARAALLDGESLVNVEIESASSNKRKGNVYRGKVTAVEPSIDAAFVDYGAAKDGFLPFDEVASKSLNQLAGHGRAGNRSGLKTGDWVLVQVTKEEVGKKGATLTMHVSLPGRFVVLMPFSDRTGISRKLGGEERARLRTMAQQLRIPEGYGCIVRTVGEDERLEDLQADLDQQVAAWESIVTNYGDRKNTGEVHVESGLSLRFVRDYMTSDVVEVIVEDETSHRELAQFLDARMPQRRALLKRYSGDMPLFLRHGVERQIEALLNNKVTLPSGGSIVIGQTEALVAIDVNSGRMKQRDIEDTAFKTNLEAAREVARQVVLRDLGGIIVVDFIDMEVEANNHAVEDELKDAFRWDKARLTFSRIQEFGLLTFSRQRLRQAVDSGITLTCPTCAGSGRVRSPNLLAMSALRKIRERLATQGNRAAFVEVTVPVEVGNFLNNRKREALTALERKFDVLIDVLGDPDALPDDLRLPVLGEVPQGRKSLMGYEESEAPEADATVDSAPEGQVTTINPYAASSIGLAPPPSPGKGRSLFRGLISKFLGLEELAEMPPPASQKSRHDEFRSAPPVVTAPARTLEPERVSAAERKPSPEPSARPAVAPRTNMAARPSASPNRYEPPYPRPPVPTPIPAPAAKAVEPPAATLPGPAPASPDSRQETEFDSNGETGEAGTRKRRRRRRRRGKGGAAEGTQNENGDTMLTSPSDALESGPIPHPASIGHQDSQAGDQTSTTGSTGRIPLPRRDAPPADDSDLSGFENQPQAKKPRSPRPPRAPRQSRGSATSSDVAVDEPSTMSGSQPASTGELQAQAITDPEAPPKKRPRHRGGRGRKKPEGAPGMANPTPDNQNPPAGDAGPNE
jgi:ribonuclease E